MEEVKRLIINLCVENLQKSMKFYTELFDFDVNFESDWYIQMTSPNSNLELALIDRNHEVTPKKALGKTNGFYLTFVVENVDTFYDHIKDTYDILNPPKDTFYGQRRLLLKDLDGAVIDVSSPIPDFDFNA